jgi:hypothetical protein
VKLNVSKYSMKLLTADWLLASVVRRLHGKLAGTMVGAVSVVRRFFPKVELSFRSVTCPVVRSFSLFGAGSIDKVQAV